MADNKDDVFGGFDAVFGALSRNTGSDDDKYPYIDPDDIVDDDDQDDDDSGNQDDDVDDNDAGNDDDQGGGDDQDDDSGIDDNQDDDDASGGDDLDEEKVISPFVDLFSKELGWDLEDEDKPKSISDLVDYMSELIEANSKPKYASEDIEKLDSFVKSGGDVRAFFKEAYGEVDYDTVDLSSELNQKRVVEELLRVKGFSDDKITKKISTYEDAGVLEEEAEDAIEILKEERVKIKEKLLKDQEKLHEEYTKKQQKFVSDVKELIDGVDNVRGIRIPKKDKDSLKDYIFKVDRDGKTAYQRDYAKNYKNLIESAYFTMKGDSLIKDVKNKAQSDAVVEFKKKLKSNQRVNRSSSNRDIDTDKPDIISAISRALIKPR